MALYIKKSGKTEVVSRPKNTRQGCSQNTKLSATASNPKKKRYRGQGR